MEKRRLPALPDYIQVHVRRDKPAYYRGVFVALDHGDGVHHSGEKLSQSSLIRCSRIELVIFRLVGLSAVKLEIFLFSHFQSYVLLGPCPCVATETKKNSKHITSA